MPSEDEYAERAKRLLRTEMVRKGIGYEQLAERMTAAGQTETAANLRNKVSRGKFTAGFFLAACDALGVGALKLDEA